MEIFQEVDRLKAQLDALRPLDPDLLKNLREVYTVRLTYNSTAIEGNTPPSQKPKLSLIKASLLAARPYRNI